MTRPKKTPYASRSGLKLDAALSQFGIAVAGRVCADLGSNAGGFVDVLLERGASRVYAVDTGYGILDYRLRRNERVIVMERTNALHVTLPEPVSLVTIDVGWTKQELILPATKCLLAPEGEVISLVKPHYEADPSRLRGGVLTPEMALRIFSETLQRIQHQGWELLARTESPLRGRGGNVEFLIHLRPPHPSSDNFVTPAGPNAHDCEISFITSSGMSKFA